MRLVVSDSAADFIETRGGRLYIWMKKNRCCGGFHTLRTATEAPPKIDFRRADDRSGGFALFVPETLSRMPDELHVELRKFPRRVEAYWNGCAWVV